MVSPPTGVEVSITSPHFEQRTRISAGAAAINFLFSLMKKSYHPAMTFSEAQRLIARSQRIVGFTGAGISTESGIPDFRSPSGVWANSRIIDYDEFIRYRESRIECWQQKIAIWSAMRDALPNAGHLAFADLERRGKLLALITQNIDRLHQRAGNTGVIELHGTITEVECLNCHERDSMDAAAERVASGDPAPDCRRCGGVLKPATIFFGQTLPTPAIEQAVKACRECDVLIAVGSSLGVHPAAALPELARRAGAHLIIINRTPTPYDPVADLVINDEIGRKLPELIGLT